MSFDHRFLRCPVVAACLWLVCGVSAVRAETPSPVLATVFPAGAKAGVATEVVVAGSSLEGLTGLRFSHDGIVAKLIDGHRFLVMVAPETRPGSYDVRTVGKHGVSSPRAFIVGNRGERVEAEPNDTFALAEGSALDTVINGRIEKPGDVDCFRFSARVGQRVVLECRAERIDSRLRGVLELYDAQGSRLLTNRGAASVDPSIDFVALADGEYVLKLFDLTFVGSAAHAYRLEIDTGPRIEFAVPAVVARGKTTRVTLFGKNLKSQAAALAVAETAKDGPERQGSAGPASVPAIAETPKITSVDEPARPGSKLDSSGNYDRVEIDVTAPAGELDQSGLRILASQVEVDALAVSYPGASAPVLLSVTDMPVVQDTVSNHSANGPQELAVPCEVSGQLIGGDEQDWFAVQVRRGEVLWLEAYGERLGSPVDLDLVVLDPAGKRELAHFTDNLNNPAGDRFPLTHLDPGGRWVAPADGRYLMMLRNLAGGLSDDPRRVYRLSVRREEPDFALAVISGRVNQTAAVNLERGGREMLEVLAVRQRGMTGPIRVAVQNLPAGLGCPDVWIPAGADRGVLMFSASLDAPAFIGGPELTGYADVSGTELARPVRVGMPIASSSSTSLGRLTDDLPLTVLPSACPVLLTAEVGKPHEAGEEEPRHFQDGMLDLAVALEAQPGYETGEVRVSALGLPPGLANTFVMLPAGQRRGWLSFSLPAILPVGPYTFVVKAETDVTTIVGGKLVKMAAVLFSNPVTIRVEPSRIALGVDPRNPMKIARGKIIQLGFTAERQHGFIGKVHVDLTVPGEVVGLRARGVTLVGRSDSGSLQVIANEDAPLGRQQFLRLEAVGTVEDRPVYHAGRFIELEITE